MLQKLSEHVLKGLQSRNFLTRLHMQTVTVEVPTVTSTDVDFSR